MPNGPPDQNESPAGPGEAKHPAFLTVFPSIMLPMFLAVVDQTIVATALPAIAAATGEAILDHAAKLGCDLLVKGAYTQSRLRQMMFGGATRHILANANLPVLMAH